MWHLLLEVLKRVQHDGGDGSFIIRYLGTCHPKFVILNLFQDPMSVALAVLNVALTVLSVVLAV